MPDAEIMVVEHEGPITIVRFRERSIAKDGQLKLVAERMTSLGRSTTDRLVLLDFAAVEHVSSGMLGVLTGLHRSLRDNGGQLRLCNVQPAIAKIFEFTRFNKILAIDPDETTAKNSLLAE